MGIALLEPVPRMDIFLAAFDDIPDRRGFCVSTCSVLLVLGDQQTSDRSLRHCPIFGG